MRRSLLGILVTGSLLMALGMKSVAWAQAPSLPRLPAQGPAPLLYVRLSQPEGMRVTFYTGDGAGREVAAPVAVGLRPGYIYRIKLSNLPEFPRLELFPTLEVRGSLLMPPRAKAADYPATIPLSKEDIEHLAAGTFLTKVVFLEHPDLAKPIATRPDQPLEYEAQPGRDPLDEARTLGRPMLIFRLGSRTVSEPDLIRAGIPGTVLVPPATGLRLPPVPPYLPVGCVPVVDPILGPKPFDEECLRDGGDIGARAGIGLDGKIGGLDPSDTVAEYTDIRNQRQFVVSNRICICVPRFALVRQEAGLLNYETWLATSGTQGTQEQQNLKSRQPSLEKRQSEPPSLAEGRLRPSASIGLDRVDTKLRLDILNAYDVPQGLGEALGTNRALRLTDQQKSILLKQLDLARFFSAPYGVNKTEQLEGPAVVGRVDGTNVKASVQEVRDVTVCCDKPLPPDKPMCLWKWADRQAAQVGDVVTFYLKFSNLGGRPITNVAVSDSLTARLEYVPGSAKTDRDSVFTSQLNEAGSAVLRWEIGGSLQPGQSGIVSFQARVR